MEHSVTIDLDDGPALSGDLGLPDAPAGVVLFAHGSGSGRGSPRNRFVASELQRAGLATLRFDLLTEADGDRRFDIRVLANRLLGARRWLGRQGALAALPVGYFGASTGAAAALVAAARDPGGVSAVVSRGGRPDLAGAALASVRAPTLLIVGGADTAVVALNRAALARLGAPAHLELVRGAGHLFEEPGALEHVAVLASTWFRRYLPLGAPASLQP